MQYQVVFRSTGKIAFSTTVRGYALDWLRDNDYDTKGRCLGLFELRRKK
jgi:hypothetical protein